MNQAVHKKAGSKHHRFITHVDAMLRQERALRSVSPYFAGQLKEVIAHLNNKGWQAFV